MLRGGCLCGRVSVEVTGPIEYQPEACHCGMCRKQTGHILAAVNIRRDALSVRGEQHVRWYRSSDKVERGFCSECGSTLFWKGDGRDYTAIAAGAIDGPTGVKLAGHIFCDDAGDYYEITGGDYKLGQWAKDPKAP